MIYTPKIWKTGEIITADLLNNLEQAAKTNADDIQKIQEALPNYVGDNVAKKDAETYTPSAVNQTIAANQYLTGDQTINGDANLTPENIKDGVSIFGVTGNYAGSGTATPFLQEKTIMPTKSAQKITPDRGYDGLSAVVVSAIPYAESSNSSGGTTVTIG